MKEIIADITKPQIKKLQWLYKTLGIAKDEKEAMLLNLTEQRTTSTAGLTKEEARDLIQELSRLDPSEKHRSLIFSLAYKAGMIYDGDSIDKKLNAVKIDQFLQSRGVVKKPLNKCTLEELKKVHRQFEGMVKNNKRTKDNKDAKEATAKLLKELNINHP